MPRLHSSPAKLQVARRHGERVFRHLALGCSGALARKSGEDDDAQNAECKQTGRNEGDGLDGAERFAVGGQRHEVWPAQVPGAGWLSEDDAVAGEPY